MTPDDIKAARVRAERFSAVTGDPDSSSVLAVLPKAKLSTAFEYCQASSPDSDNRAARLIDAGLEPYLVSDECLSLGIHPFVCVYDVLAKPIHIDGEEGDFVGLDLPGGLVVVPGNTLVAWR